MALLNQHWQQAQKEKVFFRNDPDVGSQTAN